MFKYYFPTNRPDGYPTCQPRQRLYPVWGDFFTLCHVDPIKIPKRLLDSRVLGLHIVRFGLFSGVRGKTYQNCGNTCNDRYFLDVTWLGGNRNEILQGRQI